MKWLLIIGLCTILILIPSTLSAKPLNVHLSIKLMDEEPQDFNLNNRFIDKDENGRDCVDEQIGYVLFDVVDGNECYNVSYVDVYVEEIPSANARWYFNEEVCLDVSESEIIIRCDTLI